jgi:hypothetical protein
MARRRDPNDSEVVRLDSIQVGVGMGDETTWSPVDNSKALKVRRALSGSERFVRHNARFVMRHERREEDADAWIVVTFHITVGRRGHPNYLPRATTYAHSLKGVLR